MKELADVADFLDRVRRRMRFGAFSRDPLLVLRLEWKGGSVACEWLMRPVDPWDRDRPDRVAKENQTLQSFRDALDLRDAVFQSFPAVTSANLSMFRADADHRLELMMMGSVSRDNEVFQRIPSVAMRAKMCGFKFTLAEGVLETMAPL